MQEEEKLNYPYKSNASFSIDDVEDLTFGGVSSRFWLFRKHMNTIAPRIYNK